LLTYRSFKGKPVERRGRKAMDLQSLQCDHDSQAAEEDQRIVASLGKTRLVLFVPFHPKFDKGKPRESGGRKAMGLLERNRVTMIARPPKTEFSVFAAV